MKKNKITTLSYFIKRLKDNNFIVWKIFNKYADHDSRKWTVLVNPGDESIYITCYMNATELGDCVFEFNDGKKSLDRINLRIATASMEVIINHLISHNTSQTPEQYSKVTDSEAVSYS